MARIIHGILYNAYSLRVRWRYMAAIKRSRQREAIMNNIMLRTDHPTAEDVYNSVRKEYPNISLGTVYRNLSLLVDMGHAIKVPCDDGSVHFDGRVMPHYHFQCTSCRRIYDIDFTEELESKEKELLDSVNAEFDGCIKGSSAFFYGLCRECQENLTDNKIII